jgi:hypothetical protein
VGGNPEPFVYEDYAVDWEEGDEVTEDLGEYAVSATKPDHFLPYLFEQYYEEDYGPSSSPRVEYGPWTDVAEGKIGPLVTTQWSQGDPFNKECPMGKKNKMQRSWAGCVAIAVAQIIACNEKPATSVYGVTSTWEELKQYDYTIPLTDSRYNTQLVNDLAKIIKQIGEGVKTKYDSDKSSSYPSKAKKYFKKDKYKVKYSNVEKKEGYKLNHITSMLDKGLPVFIGANDKSNKGHAWVIDGSMTQERIGTELMMADTVGHFTETRFLLHCNYGWEKGLCNGYYTSKMFNPSIGAVVPDPDTSLVRDDLSHLNCVYRIIKYDL